VDKGFQGTMSVGGWWLSRCMTSTAPDPARCLERAAPLVKAAVLDRATDALAVRRRADVALLVAAVDWAELHVVSSVDDAAHWGEPDLYAEGCCTLAGPGAPLVAEFAPLELAAELGWTPTAAQQLIADGLDLRYRLPRLWRLVLELAIPVATARYVAELTRDLDGDAARDADRSVAQAASGGHAGHLSRRRIRRLVDEVRLYHDPDRAVDDEHHALESRKVESWPGNTPATTEVFLRLDAADADAFTTAVARVAEELGRLGDPDSVEIRRARAVGVLADPQRALDLLTRGVDSGPKSTLPATLWLHVTDNTLLDLDMTAGAVTSDRLGVLSTDLLKAWLADSTVIVKPVLHVDRADAVDQHEPPAWMADLVRLRDPVCVFPGCQRPSRACDLDHIDPYIPLDHGGPPGQTHPGNLAPLCRRHHRAKTHGSWTYQRLPDGSYHWHSPSSRTFTVLPTPRAGVKTCS
jgi:hypothetical protein